MAGSKKQAKQQTSYKKKNGTRSGNGKQNGKSKVPKREDEETLYSPEIVIWILCAMMLIIELGNFGLCGFINNISRFLFGVFGIIEYVLPLIVMFAAFFLHINEYRKKAVQKVVFGSCVLICIGMIGQLYVGVEQYTFKDLYFDGFHNRIGGGILCGSLAWLLNAAVGKVGTYIIIVLAIILCVVLFAEISVIDFFKEIASAIAEEDEEEEIIERKKEKNVRKKQKRNRDYKEIVKEDFPDEDFSKRKQKSVLDSISVLPAETDQGILNAKEKDLFPKQEEVHEIKMDYALNLPGENMGEFGISDSKKEKVISKRKNQTKSAIVPDVLPDQNTLREEIGLEENKIDVPVKKMKQERRKADAIEEPFESKDKVSEKLDSISSDNTELSKKNTDSFPVEMENKTAEAVVNVAAKEVGSSDANYQFPPLELLKKGKAQAAAKDELIRQNAIKLQEVLKSFGVNVTMTNYSCGPSVTRYEMVPEQGVKVSKITGLADDLMMNLAAQSIRIEAPIPGKSAVGIEIPNEKRSGVGFRELIDTEKFIKHPSKIAFAVGKDIEGNVVVEDIAKMPHLLIAGATGSGKSVCTNTLIMSILYKARPEEVKLILIDPKQVELKVYNGIPHLLTPVVTDPKKAAGALNWAVAEMTKRYEMFSECNVRNIQGYNAKVDEILQSGKIEEEKMEKMPQIVIIVDELADLMMVAKAEVEEAIVRLAQLARAAGIHLVIATQRPSVDVVTGLIKANVPSRIALSVSSGVDSRTIIDSVGAEKLLGNGDMLFYPTMYPKPLRVQGAYISDDEVVEVVEFLKAQNGETTYSEEVTNQITSSSSGSAIGIGEGSATNEQDEYFVQAGKFIIEKNKASIGMLQRMFKIGFNRAARIMDQLFEAGVVGPEEGTKPRQVLMSEEQFEEYIDEYM